MYSSVSIDLDVAAGQLLARLRRPKYRPPVSSRTTSRSTPVEPLGLERRGVDQRRVDLDRAQVGEQPEPLAEREQALLGPDLARRDRPTSARRRRRAAPRRRLAGRQRLVGQRGAVPVDATAADQAAPRTSNVWP